MSAEPSPPSAQPREAESAEKRGVGVFQLLGLGLLLLFALIFLIAVIWSLFA